MTFTKILQNELRKRKYLTIDDIIFISNQHGHYMDTARRKLEPDITPYSEKDIRNHRVKGWKYVEHFDIFKTLKTPFLENASLQEKIQNKLFEMKIPLN